MSNAAKSYEPGADQAIERAAAGERVVVRREGTEFVAVVPLEDLRRLEALEAQEDRELARTIAESDAAFERGEGIPHEEAMRELGEFIEGRFGPRPK